MLLKQIITHSVNVELRTEVIVRSGVVEISEGINIDITDEGKIIGIEILDASKKFPIKSLFTIEFDNRILQRAV